MVPVYIFVLVERHRGKEYESQVLERVVEFPCAVSRSLCLNGVLDGTDYELSSFCFNLKTNRFEAFVRCQWNEEPEEFAESIAGWEAVGFTKCDESSIK